MAGLFYAASVRFKQFNERTNADNRAQQAYHKNPRPLFVEQFPQQKVL